MTDAPTIFPLNAFASNRKSFAANAAKVETAGISPSIENHRRN